MLRNVKNLERCTVFGTDGRIGSIDDVYFDDERWVARYLIVDTGGWLTGRKVLISPYAVQLLDWDQRNIVLNLTRDQIAGSPDIDTNRPVSRQQEAGYNSYYGYPEYWPYTTYWAWGLRPVVVPADQQVREEIEQARERDAAAARTSADSHLRSAREVAGYHIAAADDEIGHVEDFVLDDETWAIHYLVVDTRNWLPGKHVLIDKDKIINVDWASRRVAVRLTRDEVKESPEYDADAHTAGDYERALAENAIGARENARIGPR